MPVIKKAVDRFRGEANQHMAKGKLAETGDLAVLPLIAALDDPRALIAGHVAAILGELGDRRAVGPLMSVLEQKISKGEQLTTSPFYAALQKMDAPAAEPVLQKILPDSERAIRVFERQYAGIRVSIAEKSDYSGHNITYRLGYVDGYQKAGQMELTFALDAAGNWKPFPTLPAELPQ